MRISCQEATIRGVTYGSKGPFKVRLEILRLPLPETTSVSEVRFYKLLNLLEQSSRSEYLGLALGMMEKHSKIARMVKDIMVRTSVPSQHVERPQVA